MNHQLLEQSTSYGNNSFFFVHSLYSSYSDPSEIKRTISNISWYPDGAHKIAAAYSSLEFQKSPENISLDSYIWEIGE